MIHHKLHSPDFVAIAMRIKQKSKNSPKQNEHLGTVLLLDKKIDRTKKRSYDVDKIYLFIDCDRKTTLKCHIC